jgi:restriction system protein
MNDNYAWGIHAGRSGDADALFLQENCVAIGWSKIGDLSQLPADREAFKTALVSKYPETKSGAVPTTAGMLFRFAHEIQVGDLVIYPSKKDRSIHLGTCTGPYYFVQSDTVDYGSRLPVSGKRASFEHSSLRER